MNRLLSRRRASGAALAVCALLFLGAPTAGAQETVDGATWDLIEEGPARLDGIEPRYSFEVDLPPAITQATAAELLVEYRRSNLVLPTATLTVRVNGANVSSEALRDEVGRIAVDLQPGTLQPGPNDIDLTGWLELDTDIECTRPERPERWLEIDAAELRADLDLDDVVSLDDRAAALVPFGDTSPTVTYAVADLDDADHLDAAAAVAFRAGAGQSAGTRPNVVDLADFRPADSDGPVVLVGTSNADHAIESLGPSRDEGGWLRIARTTWSTPYVVVVTSGQTPGDVYNSAAVYADPTSDLSLDGDGVVILDAPRLTPAEPSSVTDLRVLGYGERTARGFGVRSLIYAVDVPYEWSPEGGVIDLEITTSTESVGGGRLTVFVNGRSLEGISLGQGNAPLTRRLSIPSAAFRPGRNFVRTEFDLGAAGSGDCAALIEPFGTIHADSALIIDHGSGGGRVDLRDLPTTFAAEVDMADLTIVLPEDHTALDVADALGIVTMLGDSSSRIAPRIRSLADLSTDERAGHLIILGEAPRQPLVAELDNELPLRTNVDTGAVDETSQVATRPGSEAIGALQLLRSPFNSNRLALVAGGSTTADARLAAQLLITPAAVDQLAGQAALGAADGEGGFTVVTFLGDDQIADPAPFISTIPLPARLLLGGVIVLFVALISLWIRQRVVADHAAAAH